MPWVEVASDRRDWVSPLCERPVPRIRGHDLAGPKTCGCDHCGKSHDFIDAFNAMIERLARLEKPLPPKPPVPEDR